MTQIHDLFSVTDKVALVTGGGRGVGLMISHALVEAGARVYITSRNAEACEKVAAELSVLGECYALPGDVSTEDQCRRLVEEFGQQEDKLHVLVNNAGALAATSLDELDDETWDAVLAVNLKAVFNLTKLFLPALEAAAAPGDPASVINIGSIAGVHTPSAEIYAYAASKAGMHHMTRLLAKRLGPTVAVNTAALGPFDTEMLHQSIAEAMGAGAPLRRHGQAEDLAGIVLYLASRAGSYVTGAVIPVDGGISTTV